MKISKWLTRLGLVFGSLMVVVSCATSNPTPNALSDVPVSVAGDPITLGYSNWIGWLPWAIAEEEDLFTANGVNVELKWFESALTSLEAMVAGQLDANSQTLSETITFAPSARNGEVIVLVNDNSDGNDKIIVAEEVNSVADLKGRQVALEEGIVGDFLLSLALEEEGLSRDEITILNMETGAAAVAFAVGQVDAVAAWVPFTQTALKRNGSKELVSSKDFPGAIPDLLVMSQTLIDERPEQVQAIVNTWYDTLEFIASNPQKSYEIMAKRAGISANEIQNFQSGVKMFTPQDNLEAFSSGNSMKHLNFAAQKIAKFITDIGFVQQIPSTDGLFDKSFVRAYVAP
ncbi:ABC transporter substrate-binding protein [Synechococcus sp. PCC 7336]|uniref:aliphatic sulfonate ABC transporter substrate-binding protein n=1 Tax=Synechococcus sp. PCC 7336 TaxID=195250 RepID=UPI00036B14A4|nr:ABC transporter substrate-binding protein [Synechococcus sp. PCC 7336]